MLAAGRFRSSLPWGSLRHIKIRHVVGAERARTPTREFRAGLMNYHNTTLATILQGSRGTDSVAGELFPHRDKYQFRQTQGQKPGKLRSIRIYVSQTPCPFSCPFLDPLSFSASICLKIRASSLDQRTGP